MGIELTYRSRPFTKRDVDTRKRRTLRKAAETLRQTVDTVVGPGVWVFTDETMTRADKLQAFYAGSIQEGHVPEVAREKAREFLELSVLAAASEELPS